MIGVVGFVVAAGTMALARSLVTGLLNRSRFPTGTLIVNATGSLTAAVLVSRVPARWATITAVAALGTFTTFSTFAVEVAALWEDRRRGTAAGYLLATTLAAVGAAFIGLAV
ncbi:MAG: CrcB family protein [Microthrixaceae bacterium]|nr:CrcB family protein [Microthrixaceae bacterium]